ncbi:unnamed protein product, partial [Symbiodinium necroappetens]
MPFQGHLYKLKRHFTAADICPLCLCKKDDAGEVSQNPSWLPTMGVSVPWDTSSPPEISIVPGLGRPEAIRPDIFHLGHLGICRDVYLGCIISLAMVFGHFGGKAVRSLDGKLANAYQLFKSYCHLRHSTPFAKHWTRENFNFKGPRYPDCSFKASDSYLILKWLEDYLSGPPWDDSTGILGLMLSTIVALSSFYHLCYTSPSRQWLRDSLAKQVEQSLQTFLSDYYKLALWAYRSGVLVYRFVPKLHAWKHIHLRLQGELALARGYTFNPAIYATANDEDFVGKASRPIRDLHSGNASLRRLELYRIELQREWG